MLCTSAVLNNSSTEEATKCLLRVSLRLKQSTTLTTNTHGLNFLIYLFIYNHVGPNHGTKVLPSTAVFFTLGIPWRAQNPSHRPTILLPWLRDGRRTVGRSIMSIWKRQILLLCTTERTVHTAFSTTGLYAVRKLHGHDMHTRA